jgi:hypothetical protein
MTFFYNLNKRLQELTKPATDIVNENVERMAETSYSAKSARAGKDIGKPGKQFDKIAKSAAERYGSKERGEKVAGAVLAKLRAKESVEEADMDEGNEFSGALAQARETGSATFKVDGKTYQVKEAEISEREFQDKDMFDRQAQTGDTYRGTKGTVTKTRSGETHRRRHEEEPEVDDDKPKAKGRPQGTKRAIGAKGPSGRSKLLKKDAIRETEVEEDYDRDEYDEEGEMAKSQSRTIADAAQELQLMLGDNENLPEWVQKKINLAQEYIDTVRDYLAANRPEQEMEESALQAYLGKKKYGEQGMKALQKAGRDGASKEKMAKIRAKHDKLDEVDLEEKAVSQAQRRAAGIARAAQKGDIPQSELRGASKAMAKMPAGELKKFAKTKEKSLPKKKEVEETTTAGSVAPAAAEPKKSKGGMTFGKGIYDSFNREVENLIAESMNVSMNVSSEGQNSVTVTATEDDAVKLAEILKMAGVGAMTADSHACPACGESPCGCAEQVDENQPDWPTNAETSDDALQYSGGLNKPKVDVAGDGQSTVPVTAVRTAEEDDLARLREMAGIVAEAKPDFLDLDQDGDRTEPMKKAAKEKQDDKEVRESILDMSRLWQAYKG